MKKHIQHNIEVTERIVSNQNSSSLNKMKELRYNNIVSVVTSHVNKDLPLLDIGARKGELLDMFNNEGFKHLYAIEIWSTGIEIIKKKKYNIVKGQAESFCLSNIFGTVIMSHVLEHCPNPDIVIQLIYNSLVVNGMVYIEVPAQKKGDAPISAGHYSFFPDLNSIISLFDDKWVLIDSGNLRKRKKNIFILMQKIKDGK